jgi:hypothetical protein
MKTGEWMFSSINVYLDKRCRYVAIFTWAEHTQKKVAASKVNNKFISHPTQAQNTLSAAGTVQVSHVLIAFLQCVHLGSQDTHPHGNQTHLDSV